MIVTSGGGAIPDTSGGRLAALIGTDGGFIYNRNFCNGAYTQYACGAYGAWTASILSYGFSTMPTGGYVASRTYVAPEQDSGLPWLERNLQIQPDPNFSYNTMTTDLYMTQGKNINMAQSGFSGSGGAINLQNGTINMQGGTLTGTGTSNISMVNAFGNPAPNSTINVGSGCNKSSPSDNSCPAAIQVANGDVTVANLLSANSLYATTFIYNASDMRLKTDIQPIHNALDDIMRLKPVSFVFKSNGKPSLGVIAQDVEKVYPQLVTQGEGMKSVSYEGLIGPLIGAVQDLKQQNDQLRQQLKDQAVRQQQLEKEIGAIKAAN